VILAVILSSVGLAWWSFAKVLPPLQDRNRELSSTVSRLGTEVDELDRRWPKAAADQVTNNYQRVRAQLFSNEADFANWLANLSGQASTLTLDAKADFGKTARSPLLEKRWPPSPPPSSSRSAAPPGRVRLNRPSNGSCN